MDEFNKIFEHRPEYRIVICKRCRFAVIPRQTAGHLLKHRIVLSAPIRQTIVAYIQQLDDLAYTKDDVIYPSPTSELVKDLPIFHGGLRCTGDDEQGSPCTYICESKKAIQRHCKTVHGWINPQKRGGNSRVQYSRGDG